MSFNTKQKIMTTYIGNKGYSIYKDTLTVSQQNEIKKDLTVKPFAPPNSIQKPVEFSIYRESTKKLYVPRFYGIKKYGEPQDVCITDGDDIDVAFKGEMRDYQNKIVDTYLKEAEKSGCGLLEIPCGRGKCLGYDTPVLMSDYSIKMVQHIKNGDYVMGDNYMPRIVMGVNSGVDTLYCVHQSNGMDYVVNSEHILTLYDTLTNHILDMPINKLLKEDEIITIITRYKGIKISHDKEYVFSDIMIEKKNTGQYYGFTIGGNHRFLLGDTTVTHNTVMALNIISKLKKKTLVIVHKEFLLNQWIERINQFLPDARVGKIQGQIVDIKDKDIVIGMLQSLSMKEYPVKTFHSFGLTINDECHHISAEVFCRSLFKIVTKYMLGLSATMNRKDGLTKVFKMFLGDVVYKEKREADDKVIVKTVQYKSKDPDFAETIYNFKGQTHYALMIRKLCEFNQRSELILKILINMLAEDEKRQVMILAHNKSLLKYLYDAIEHRNISSVGYYIGGMKEKALKETESKRVVIATYAMAEEALDIKSLSALILATPKTDVTQAVGRILRMKHDNPLVVDIVDQHDVFQKQYIKRRRFYMKCKYSILQTTSERYNKDNSDFDTIYEPGEKSEIFKKKIKMNEQSKMGLGKCLLDFTKFETLCK